MLRDLRHAVRLLAASPGFTLVALLALALGIGASTANFLEWRDRNHSFERIAALVQQPMNLAGEGEPEQVLGLVVTDGFFEILGARAALGRTFRPEEDTPGKTDVVILSHELWQRRWGGDRAVIGRKIIVNNTSVEVVGVMPPAFRFP